MIRFGIVPYCSNGVWHEKVVIAGTHDEKLAEIHDIGNDTIEIMTWNPVGKTKVSVIEEPNHRTLIQFPPPRHPPSARRHIRKNLPEIYSQCDNVASPEASGNASESIPETQVTVFPSPQSRTALSDIGSVRTGYLESGKSQSKAMILKHKTKPKSDGARFLGVRL